MRTAKFEAVRINEDSPKPWRVNVPAQYSVTGRRQQLFFATQPEAQREIREIRARSRSLGDMLHSLDHHELSEAVRSLELLQPTGVGLLEAVKAFIADRQKRMQSRTFGQVFDSFEALRPNRSHDYLKEIEHTRANVRHLLDRSIIDIQPGDLESALAQYAPSTRDARIRRLRSVFNEAVRQGWVSSNPADKLNIIGARHDEVRIYAVEEVARMLSTALEQDKPLIPFLAIAAFCGLRPENELFNLRWQDVHIDDPNPQIVIRPETSKTRRRRFVDISANCIEWVRASTVNTQGRVVPFSASTLTRKRQALCEDLALDWIPDGFRHTYCSAHLAKHGDVNKLLIQTGHSNPGMLWRHYYRVMPSGDADKYWQIFPPAQAENVVPMAQAS